jgi:purine-nucleoside phosphorylase
MTEQEPVILPGPGDRLAEEATAAIRRRTKIVPEFAVVLGSGLAAAAAGLEVDAEVPFEEIPGFPPPSVPGHPGRLLLGTLAGRPAVVFVGRLHFYEGHSLGLCALPVRVAAELQAHTVVLTASAGGLDRALSPGSLVVGEDHLNLMGENPLRGWRRPDGTPAFVDLAHVYDADLAKLAEVAAGDLGLDVARGVYAAVPGPSYETPAEIEYLRRAGATVVGMSVVPEAVPACALGLRVLGLFVVTNAVGGLGLDHQAVLRVAESSAGGLGRLISGLAPELGERH